MSRFAKQVDPLGRFEQHPAVGRRVRLVRCDDEWTRLEPGAVGTVRSVDDAGTYHVEWDSGARLGLVPGEDEWEWLDRG